MGAWGIGNFQNDGALDFLGDLEDGGKDLFRESLEKIANMADDAYLEAPDCEIALAAAELVAAAKGAPLSDLPDEAKEWLSKNNILGDSDIIELAKRAVIRIKTKSEIQELWEESDEFQQWQQAIEGLEKRMA